MGNTSKGASLDPSTHQGGGQVPNGDYDIVKVRASLFTYPGNGAVVPAIMVTYKDASTEYEQMYKAGDTEHLVPSDDGHRFVHPQGESASIYKGGAASMWLGSLVKQGFAFTGDDVTQIEGIKVKLENLAAPRGKTSENAEKTIPMVVKIIGKVAVAGRPTGAKNAASATAPSIATPAASSANGDALNDVAIGAIVQALEAAPDHTLKVKGLAVRCLKFAPGSKLNDLTKLMTPEWLAANADVGGWASDGEVLVGG